MLVSYDLDEIRALSDRIVVFSEGRISGSVMPSEADDVTMGNLMTGATAHVREALRKAGRPRGRACRRHSRFRR